MNESSAKPSRYSARHVLQTKERIVWEAAAELLDAVRELFPERFKELRALAEQLASEYNDGLAEDDKDNKDAEDRFWQGVQDWTASNAISCPAVNQVAARYAEGDFAGFGPYIDLVADKVPSLMADPHNETLQQFLKKAREHYYEVLRHKSVECGDKRAIVKRDREHFRWLAKRLVGSQTWAQIAEEDERVGLDDKSVGTAARDTARLIGLSLPTKRGPRTGSKNVPRNRRRQLRVATRPFSR